MPSLNSRTDRIGPRTAACANTQPRRMPVQRSVRIGLALVLLVATCVGVGLILTQSAEAHGTCANHQYRTYDGTHDGDGDGVGCESKPEPSSGRSGASRPRWATTATTGASAQAARAPAWAVAPANTLTTSSRSKRHTIPALPHGRARAKPSSPTTPRICGASQPASISANPMATSPSGPAARAHSASNIATVTQQVKSTYGLSTDGAEHARDHRCALAAQCTPLADSQSGTQRSPRQAARRATRGRSASPAARQRLRRPRTAPTAKPIPINPSGASPRRRCESSPSPHHLMDYCHDDSWRQLVPNN